VQDFLATIKKSVLKRVETIPIYPSLTPNSLDFCEIFLRKTPKPAIIAEIKFKSPLKGVIYHGKLKHMEIAQAYLNNGACALSILTEPIHFHGSINYLQEIRQAMPKAHLLLKDFVLSERQVRQAVAAGANAILLIKAFLTDKELVDLYTKAVDLGLTPIVEVHDLNELAKAEAINAKVIGINNRNLQTLKIDLNTARKLIKNTSKPAFFICESGIEKAEQIKSMMESGFDGFLIGSSLMVHNNPGEALANLLRQVNAR